MSTIDPKALEKAARAFLTSSPYEEGSPVRCGCGTCDSLATVMHERWLTPRCDAHAVVYQDDPDGWRDLPQAALVRLLGGEP